MHLFNKDVPPPIEELRLAKLDRPKESNGRWTWEKKYSVVATFLKTGNIRETGDLTGVSWMTIESWRKQPWWLDLVQQIKNTDYTVLDNQLSKLINKSLGSIEDALDNGEMILNNKTGELVRKPVAVRDATRIASELMQRKQSLQKSMMQEQVTQVTVQETLKALAQEFAKWNNQKSPELEIVQEVPEDEQ